MNSRFFLVRLCAALLCVPLLTWADDARFPDPPTGYDVPREGIPHGTLTLVEYPSTTVGIPRKAHVYLPPGYDPNQQYPVFYLLHGIGGDESEWVRHGVPQVILDNLYADQKLMPMIVVLPNGRAAKDIVARDPIPKQVPAFEAFEKDLLNDLIPFIEQTYPVRTDRQFRALAGLSMGGGQALNFGLNHVDRFAWIGGFSSAPNTRRPSELVRDVPATRQLRVLYVSCGDQDGLFSISQGVHKTLEDQKIPHLYQVIPGGKHDFVVWRSDLYNFAQLLFRETPSE